MCSGSYSLLQNKGKYGLVSTEKKSAMDKQVNNAVKYDADNDYADDEYADDDYDDNDTINGDEDDYEDAEDYEDAYYEDDYEDDDDDDAYTYDDFHSVVSENSRLYEQFNIKPIPNIEITLTPASESLNENVDYKDLITNPSLISS